MKGLMNGWPGFRYQLADTCIFWTAGKQASLNKGHNQYDKVS